MIIGEILAGIVVIFISALCFFLATLKEETRFTRNPFYDFLGISQTTRRAYAVIGGAMAFLIGLIMILQGFGYLR
jgi:hypothetical protein